MGRVMIMATSRNYLLDARFIGTLEDVMSNKPTPKSPKQIDGSGQQGLDPADPHPAEEGNPYAARRPGGANPPSPDKDIGPNPSRHD